MKRSSFKRKISKPLKRGKLKKQSKQKISVVQRKLWELCKQIIKIRYGDECYTCGRYCEGSNRHTGHMWAKASLGAFMKYDLRVLRPQCYHCNINLGGLGAVFYKKMLDENGPDYMDALEQDRKITVDDAMSHYLHLIERYTLNIKEHEIV
jgi:hypothetical protein